MTADTERDALVANLRARQDIRGTFRLMDDAADQIRRDGERIAELGAENDRLRSELEWATRLVDRIEALEGALRGIVQHEAFLDLEYLSADLNEKLDLARAALAKAGKSDPIKNVKEPQ